MIRLLLAGIALAAWLAPAHAQFGGIQQPGVTAPLAATNGAASRTLADRLGADAVLSVRDFATASGAVACTGSDDYAAFNSALTKLYALGGGVLQVPAATCLTSAAITVPGGSSGYALIRIVGAGPASIITPTASMAAVIVAPSGQLDVENLSLINASSYATAGIEETKTNNNLPTRYRNLRISGFTKGIQIASGDNFDIESNFFLNNTLAVSLEGGCLNGRVRSNYVLGGNGINFPWTAGTQCEGIALEHNDILPGSSGTYALQILSGLQIDATDNIFDQITSGPGVIIDATNHAIADITIKGGWIGAQGGATGQTHGVYINGTSGSTPQYITISAVTFVNWLGYDIDVAYSNGLNLTDNRIASTGGTGNIYLNNAAATVLRGNNMKNTTASVVEAGTTVSYATMNVFGVTPTRNASSQYLFNNGDLETPFAVAGQTSVANIAHLLLTVAPLNAQIGCTGVAACYTTFNALAAVLLSINNNTVMSVSANNVSFAKSFVDTSETEITSGSSTTVQVGSSRLVLHGPTSYTITMQASPTDGLVFELECDQTTSLTMAANATPSGVTLTGTATSCSTTQGHRWHYHAATTAWKMDY